MSIKPSPSKSTGNASSTSGSGKRNIGPSVASIYRIEIQAGNITLFPTGDDIFVSVSVQICQFCTISTGGGIINDVTLPWTVFCPDTGTECQNYQKPNWLDLENAHLILIIFEMFLKGLLRLFVGRIDAHHRSAFQKQVALEIFPLCFVLCFLEHFFHQRSRYYQDSMSRSYNVIAWHDRDITHTNRSLVIPGWLTLVGPAPACPLPFLGKERQTHINKGRDVPHRAIHNNARTTIHHGPYGSHIAAGTGIRFATQIKNNHIPRLGILGGTIIQLQVLCILRPGPDETADTERYVPGPPIAYRRPPVPRRL